MDVAQVSTQSHLALYSENGAGTEEVWHRKQVLIGIIGTTKHLPQEGCKNYRE
jgi:hypothetical protein